MTTAMHEMMREIPIRNAYNFVVGEIPGATLQGDGLLLNKDTGN